MGTADVIPGVSGGTMAFILGIYPELIAAIKSFDLIWLRSIVRFDMETITSRPHFGFIFPLLFGIGAALLFFTRVIPLPELLQRYPEQVYGLFFGLISGSSIVLLRNMIRVDLREMMVLVAGTVLGLIIFNIVPLSTPDSWWFIFLSGALAICAMILPGISGSFILLILGKYTYIFNAIGYLNSSVLIPFILGAITGLAVFSRVLAWVLHRFYRDTILAITGLLISSLYVIWPFQDRYYEYVEGSLKLISSSPRFPDTWHAAFFVTFILILAGLISVLFMDIAAARKRSGKA